MSVSTSSGEPAPKPAPEPTPKSGAKPLEDVAAASDRQLLWRLMSQYVRPYLKPLAVAMLCMIVVAVCTAGSAWLLEPAIDRIFIRQDKDMLIILPLAIISLAVLRGIATFGQGMLMNGTGQRVAADIQVQIYNHIIRSDLSYLNRLHTGEILAKVLNDANLLREALARAVSGLVRDLVTALALTGVMFYQDWKLALVVTMVLPIAAMIMRRIGKRSRKASTAMQVETGRLSAHMADTLEAARIVKAYGMEQYETTRARAAVDRRLKELLSMVKTRAISSPLMEALGGVAVGGAIYYGGLRGLSGELTLGTFMSFLAALLMAYQPIKSLATMNTVLQSGLSAAQRIFELLDTEPAIKEPQEPTPMPAVTGEIRFEDLHFDYGDGVAALQGINFTVPAGSTIALVGPSGAGKSTLLNLLPRFYDPSSGAVRIDGVDIREFSFADLRRASALVTQDPILFDDTIEANIHYGRPSASQSEMREAARQAAADGFIMGFPDGYQTMVGEGGVRLSGGQRQRIAIARAILKNAPILLLDEATSALDSESELQVQGALDALSENRTTLVIAHRLSTIMSADMIMVLEAGRVVEYGNHGELLAKDGTYARLYQLQFAVRDGKRTTVSAPDQPPKPSTDPSSGQAAGPQTEA